MNGTKVKWVRDSKSKFVGGVFSGLGKHVNVNPNIFRAGWAAITVFYTFAAVIAYIILYFYMDPDRARR